MNAEQLELFRDLLLRSLKASRSVGLTLTSLDVSLHAMGCRHFTKEDLEDELQYFVSKELVEEVVKTHSVGNKLWRLTAAGVDDLEKRGI